MAGRFGMARMFFNWIRLTSLCFWHLRGGGTAAGLQISGSSLDPHSNLFPKPNRIVKRDREELLAQDFPESVNLIPTSQVVALTECQHQFSSHRWNCTFSKNISEESILNKGLLEGSKEAAFVAAIQNAALVFVVTVGCSSGRLPECSCYLKVQGETTGSGWRWGGCSDDTGPGLEFARNYFDSIERLIYRDHTNVVSLMNLHNNKAGRLAVRDRMLVRCRCHGVSGSCAFRTCWRSLATFREVGDYLRDQYIHSKRVKTKEPRSRRTPPSGERGRVAMMTPRARRTDLVHLAESPDYCTSNEDLGVMGTKDRVCATDGDPFGIRCRFLCCDRGHKLEVTYSEESCQCMFHWCCKVVCNTCQKRTKHYICN